VDEIRSECRRSVIQIVIVVQDTCSVGVLVGAAAGHVDPLSEVWLVRGVPAAP
jgi:hypothetical protein